MNRKKIDNEMAQIWEWSAKSFKSIIKILQWAIMSVHEINGKKKASQDRETEDIKRNQMKIIQLKNIVIEMKSSGNGLNIWRGGKTEKTIRELENRTVKVT